MAVENDQQKQQQQQQIKSNNFSSSSSSSVSASPSLIANNTSSGTSTLAIVNGNCSGNNQNSGISSTAAVSVASINPSSVSIMSNKSETSSNASCNGSINKKSSSISSQLSGINTSAVVAATATSTTAAAAATITASGSAGPIITNNQNLSMNSSSREDITSLGGGSSVNSQQSTTTQQQKGIKDNLQHHYYNGTEIRYSNTTNDDDDDDGLGPLPPKWEKAYTENGELYFIDHNTGTSHWLDPRLSKFQKKSLEDCMDDELPYGWEKIHDPQYGTYFIDHVNRRTQYENPVLEAKRRAERNRNEQTLQQHHHQQHHNQHSNQHNFNSQNKQQQQHQQHQHQQQQHQLPYTFTRNPSEMRGERITTTLLKSSRGLGITIVGGDDNVEEFLQIKSIVPNGPAWLDGKLQTGDILVYVNDTCVLGFTHHEMVNVFQSILPGETVTLEVCRGYPLPFDPNDPNTEVVTTIAVDGISSDPEKARILMDLNMDGNYNFLDMSDSAGAVGGGDGNGSLNSVGGGNISQKNPLAKIQSGACGMAVGNNLDLSGGENYIGDEFIMLKKPEILTISIVKGAMGFGFTIADSAYGQKVKKILDRNCCKNLQEGDILLEINNTSVKHMSHSEVVQVLKDCPKTKEALLKVQRGHYYTTNANLNTRTANKLRKTTPGAKDGGLNGSLFRSKTPTADLYSTQPKEILPIRPKTPLVDTRRARVKTPSNELNEEVEAVTRNLEKNDENKSIGTDAKSNNSLQEVDSINNDIPFMDPFPKLVTSLSERLAEASLIQDNHNNIYQHPADHHHMVNRSNYENSMGGGSEYNYNLPYGNSVVGGGIGGIGHNPSGIYSPAAPLPIITPVPTYHQDTCYCFECQDYNRYQMDYHHQGQIPTGNGGVYHPHHQYIPPMPINQNGKLSKRVNEYIPDRKGGFSPLDNYHSSMVNGPPPPQHFINQPPPVPPLWKYGISPNSVAGAANLMQPITEDEYTLSEVTLERQALGFGFRIVGGTEEGSQVTVGHIVPGGAADGDVGIATGDEILSIDGVNVVNASHHKVVSLMGEAALRGQVTMILRRRVRHSSVPTIRRYPYDVIVSRHENEGFGFVIISSSNQYYGSTIGKLIPGSPADRCGELKVGDRIIAVNRIDIAGMSHGDVVNLIKESGLHVRLTIGCPKETITIPGQTNQILTTSPHPPPPPLLQPSSQSLITPIIPPQSSSSVSAIKSEQLPQQQQQQQQQQQSSSYSDRSQLIQHPQL